MVQKSEKMTIGEIIDNLLSVIIGKLNISVIEDDMCYIIGCLVENKVNVLYYYINFQTSETNIISKFSVNEFADCESCYRIDIKHGDIETMCGVELVK